MRHNKKFNHLGRTSSHRKAMLANMACSLIMHKRIKTTVAKAKALRMYVEPFSHLQDNKAVKELFEEVRDKVAERNGGFTRILKLGNRVGDAAEICYIELVDYNANMLTAPKASSDKKKTRRSRKKADAPVDKTEPHTAE